jgi:hypothetical protein
VKELDADAPSGAPGDSPDHRFVLVARHPGEATLRFEQRRPWESVPARETREVSVSVRASEL